MRLVVSPIQRFSSQFLANRDRLQYRAIAVARAADVVDFAAARILQNLVKRANQVSTVDTVAHLFAFVSEDSVRLAGGRAFHQVGKESMRLRSRVIWPSKTTAAKTSGVNTEVLSILLHHHVSRNLRGAEQAVQGLVNGEFFRNPLGVLVLGIDFPSRLLLPKR